MKSHSKISRRRFLGQAACAGVGSTALYSSLLNLKALGALAGTSSASGDYKALVCIFLRGGNDSFNMLVPRGDTEYGEYQETRSDLAIAQDDLLPLDFTDSDGRVFGLHPSMGEVQELFNRGNATFVANVGTLVEPLTKSIMESGGRSVLPRNLYSHADQAMQWQTSVPDSVSKTGFAGRLADLLHVSRNTGATSMNISLGGNNVFQTGDSVVGYAVNRNGQAPSINAYDKEWHFSRVKTSAINSLMDATYQDLFRESFAEKMQTSVEDNLAFQNAMEFAPEFSTQFSDTRVSQELQSIAKIVAVREHLGMARQTFFVNFGGWDHHDDTLVQHAEMLGELSSALGEFNSALEEIGMNRNVTTFTASDFGRTLTSNGKGSDHAWGGNHLVMGGAVDGQQIFGEYPSLALKSELEIGRGRLIPTISTDEYFAELALWFGAKSTDLDLLLPNIGRFYDVRSGVTPIGFLS